jgi:hypothetical protein
MIHSPLFKGKTYDTPEPLETKILHVSHLVEAPEEDLIAFTYENELINLLPT